MNQQEYFKRFTDECAKLVELTGRKNRDYARGTDAFQNFRGIEFWTDGKITAEEGIIVRLSDKFQRVCNLVYKEADVKDEAITDTLRDIAAYALILKIYLGSKSEGHYGGKEANDQAVEGEVRKSYSSDMQALDVPTIRSSTGLLFHNDAKVQVPGRTAPQRYEGVRGDSAWTGTVGCDSRLREPRPSDLLGVDDGAVKVLGASSDLQPIQQKVR